MPLYFFDSYDGQSRFVDNDGTELANDDAARQEAVQAMAEMVKDAIPENGPRKDITMVVRTSAGEALMELTINFTLALIGAAGSAKPRHSEDRDNPSR